jgi:hypothetical protein
VVKDGLAHICRCDEKTTFSGVIGLSFPQSDVITALYCLYNRQIRKGFNVAYAFVAIYNETGFSYMGDGYVLNIHFITSVV